MSEANDLITIPNQHSSNEVVDFECNICFDLAQDPVITLCGHLHCWPCLYKWLKLHSLSHECPVCKALIQEENLVPLYGRGKARSDPRSKPVPGLEIPSRPAGQRPETAPSPAPPAQDNRFSNGVFRQMGRFEPAGFRNFGVLASFGGVLSPALGVQFHGVLNAGGSSLGFHHYGNHGSVRDREDGYVQTSDEKFKKILYFILFFLLFALLTV